MRTKDIPLVSMVLKGLVPILFVLLLFVHNASGSAHSVLYLDFPEKIYLGQPYMLNINSGIEFDYVQVNWLGEKIHLLLRKQAERYSAGLLLGSDVKKQKPGTKQLQVIGHKGGLQVKEFRQIELREKEYPVQRLSLPSKMVTLDEQTLMRCRREAAEIKKTLSSYSWKRDWQFPFVRPAEGVVTSPYGVRRVINGKPRSPHRGIDLAAPMGSEILACNQGRIALIADHFFAGKSIYIDHGQGLVSMYFHLSEIKTSPGDRVTKGEVIGLAGQSGRSTGPHLHFGLSIFRQLIDPQPLLHEKYGLGDKP